MRVSTFVHERVGGVVQRGPFRGMRLGTVLTDTSSKLLGSYERELHEVIEQLLETRPEQIVHAGSADGYYAVGCKLRLPSSDVWAFDASEYMQEIVVATAELNGLSVEIGGFLDPDGLETIAGRKSTLVICDCEGCEYDLLEPRRAPSIRTATLLVELQDAHTQPDDFVGRFSVTHRTTLIESEPRVPTDYPELDGLADNDRSLAVFERPFTMAWAVLEPVELR